MYVALTHGGNCGGDAAGTFYRIRNRTVVSKADACGDCGTADANWKTLTAPYGNRQRSTFGVWPGPDGWTLLAGKIHD